MQLAFHLPLHEPAGPLGRVERQQTSISASRIRGQVADSRILVGQEGSVGREDAVPCRELDQFLDELVVLALEVQFVEDLADPADRPELLDEGVRLVAALFDQVDPEIELLPLAVDRSGNDHLGPTVLLVAADHHELLAGEKIEGALRIEPIDGRSFLGAELVEDELDVDVGHHRRLDAAVEPPDAVFDVFVGPHVFALAEVRAREPVQQPAVDVEADAEAENPRPDPVRLLGVADDLHLIGHPGGGQPVGQEEHVAGPARVL